MLDLVWLVPALPLAGFLILVVLGRRMGEPGAGWLATAMCGGAFVATAIVLAGMIGEQGEDRRHLLTLFEWIKVGGFRVEVGFLADPLSITMALFITGIGTLIHLYSISYMHGDPKFSKFFIYMNLFVFSMLMLVLGSNMLVTFLGWEGVGACSYLLIAFWFSKDANASAGKKAFVTNRIGDWGFMCAMFLTFAAVGSLDYSVVLEQAPRIAPATATAIALLLFLGACGKSAQLPLFVWLPDAMAGPTPVSALIHAATMVTAGVYLMTRVSPILTQSYDWAPSIIAWVGVITALFAATIALAQTDIKKVLAYSTVSQLGFMFLAIGSGGYVAAIFHMITHAFFKALLFLGAGSVIHGLHDEQDMRRMGNLKKYMPITAATFIVGWLAIAGVPPFAGFWSKDEILLNAYEKNPALWFVGLVTALLTALYMSRQVFMVFFGEERWRDSDHAAAPEPHESPWKMTLPLVVLAGLATVAGALDSPFGSRSDFLERWLEPVVGENEQAVTVATSAQIGLGVLAVLCSLVGIAVAYRIYYQRKMEPIEPAIMAEGWKYDTSIAAFMGGPGRKAFEATAAFDGTVIDGAVNGVATLVRRSGVHLRKVQNGFVRTYALGVAVGVVALLAYFLSRVTF
ncbi:MAG: NADH-quinone oxidoreductase subunit L [Acidimicrobiia bacterium]|nr:NADH-quinone oxidoreductase subunit L [Acidimicrobiia bacterium]